MRETVIGVVLAMICVHAANGKSIVDGPKNSTADPFDDRRMHPTDFADEHRTDSQDRDHVPLDLQANLELTSEFWINNGKKFIDHQLRKTVNKQVAKNIIFFLGDGMSIPTLAALRMYQGGEETKFSFENFPGVGMSKTYSVDHQVADSACTATGT